MATHAVAAVPHEWILHTKPGGLVLADLRSPGLSTAGALALLTVTEERTAEGRLLPIDGGFMNARTSSDHADGLDMPVMDKTIVHERQSAVPTSVLDIPEFAFAVWRAIPDIMWFPGNHTLVATPDGRWAEASNEEPATTQYGGPGDLWGTVETVHHTWLTAGKPGCDSYTITVTRDGHTLVEH